MKYLWRDYKSSDAAEIESWLDDDARYYIGCGDGFDEYVRYWTDDEHTDTGKNFFVKTVADADGKPIAALALFYTDEQKLSVSEIIVAPQKRHTGIGSAVLCELVQNGESIIGIRIKTAVAAIFPDNKASVRAFEKAGFRYGSTHPDGDIAFYIYTGDGK